MLKTPKRSRRQSFPHIKFLLGNLVLKKGEDFGAVPNFDAFPLQLSQGARMDGLQLVGQDIATPSKIQNGLGVGKGSTNRRWKAHGHRGQGIRVHETGLESKSVNRIQHHASQLSASQDA